MNRYHAIIKAIDQVTGDLWPFFIALFLCLFGMGVIALVFSLARFLWVLA